MGKVPIQNNQEKVEILSHVTTQGNGRDIYKFNNTMEYFKKQLALI